MVVKPLFFVSIVLVVFFLFPNSKAIAQYPSECAMDSVPPEVQILTITYGGREISSMGTLRVLMIWVRFADDNESTAIWPNPSVLPEWAQRFVDTAYSASGNYFSGTVSHYFYENSYGKMHVIGDVYYVMTDHSEDYYHQLAYSAGASAARSAIETEVLNKLDNSPYNVDFNRYDTWKFRIADEDFHHESGVDHKVDMIWFMTRNLHDGSLPSGQAAFGIGIAALYCPTHVRDGVTIAGGFPGSGITMFSNHIYKPINSSTATDGNYPLVSVVAHEMSHYLFGAGHFARGDIFLGPSDLPPHKPVQFVYC